ncbi:hypothetical protein BH23VER1_BH23VER1_10150 [soil metagenome]
MNQYASITGMAPSYDDDGNLLADGDFAYEWDADNRLVAAGSAIAAATVSHLPMQWDAVTASPRQRAQRRPATPQSPARTAGINLVATYLDDATETDALHCTWTWGPDLSGSLQGAGGVGGRLAQHKRLGAGSYVAYPCLDGNGNIWQYAHRARRCKMGR